MEILIVICLLIVIILLLQDKIVNKKASGKENNKVKLLSRLPDIMGVPKPRERLSMPSSAFESQLKKRESESYNFEQEIKEKDFDNQIPQEELDDVFGKEPDLWAEEEEWNRYGVLGVFDGEDGFATGVTFSELGTVGMVLRAEKPEPSLEKQAVTIVHKIQDTDLFSLLENSMEGASRKIAELLDRSLFLETDSGSSFLRNNKDDDFDISEFV